MEGEKKGGKPLVKRKRQHEEEGKLWIGTRPTQLEMQQKPSPSIMMRKTDRRDIPSPHAPESSVLLPTAIERPADPRQSLRRSEDSDLLLIANEKPPGSGNHILRPKSSTLPLTGMKRGCSLRRPDSGV